MPDPSKPAGRSSAPAPSSPARRHGAWRAAVVAVLVAGIAVGAPRSPTGIGRARRPLHHATRSLDLALGEGAALSQNAVPVRLPVTLEPLFNPTRYPFPPTQTYFQTMVVGQAYAPPLTPALFNFPPAVQPGSIPSVARGEAFPVKLRVPGYAVILGTGSQMAGPVSLTATTAHLLGIVLAFIGEPAGWAQLPPAAKHVPLGQGLAASIYSTRPAHVLGGTAIAATMIVWQEGPDMYAIYSVGYSTSASVLTRLARSMARTLIIRVTPATFHLREFLDTNVSWWNTSFQGRLKTETVQIQRAGTPGYIRRDDLGVRVESSVRRVTAHVAPPWPSPSRADPTPVLARALPYLKSMGIPIRLPAFVPLRSGLWPRLDMNTGPNSYAVFIRESAVNLPPNTLYAIGVGLGAWVGEVEGSRRPISPANVPPADAAPPVHQDRVTGSWLRRYSKRDYYWGTVILSNGVKALLIVDLAGDGDHTQVLFRERGIYYEVGNYHSARLALKMAASMVLVRSPGASARS